MFKCNGICSILSPLISIPFDALFQFRKIYIKSNGKKLTRMAFFCLELTNRALWSTNTDMRCKPISVNRVSTFRWCSDFQSHSIPCEHAFVKGNSTRYKNCQSTLSTNGRTKLADTDMRNIIYAQ